MPLPPQSRGTRQAFTLIELLTVIAIIGILAAILIPTVGKVRESARKSNTTSNLRQMGMAVLGYAADNRDTLPGPSLPSGNAGLEGAVQAVTRFPDGNQSSQQRLVYHIGPYLGGFVKSDPANASTVASVIMRDSFAEQAVVAAGYRTSTSVAEFWNAPVLYALNRQISFLPGSPMPFGSPAAGNRPKTLASIANAVPLTRVWMIMQADEKLDNETNSPVTSATVDGKSPPNPLYTGFRFATFFDASVRQIPVGTDLGKVL